VIGESEAIDASNLISSRDSPLAKGLSVGVARMLAANGCRKQLVLSLALATFDDAAAELAFKTHVEPMLAIITKLLEPFVSVK
jgi:hypothetical protein